MQHVRGVCAQTKTITKSWRQNKLIRNNKAHLSETNEQKWKEGLIDGFLNLHKSISGQLSGPPHTGSRLLRDVMTFPPIPHRPPLPLTHITSTITRQTIQSYTSRQLTRGMPSILQVVYHLLRNQKKTSDPIESNIYITVVNTNGLNIGLTLFRYCSCIQVIRGESSCGEGGG